MGYDKAVPTHFKHDESFNEFIYDEVKEGWYQPTTGGNFHYGILGGYSTRHYDMYMKIG